MLAADSRVVAGFMDAPAISRLWEIARGVPADADAAVSLALFPPILHIPNQTLLFRDGHGTDHHVMGTWHLVNLLDYLRSEPGRVLHASGVEGRPGRVCVFGLDGVFPSFVPHGVVVPFGAREPLRFAAAGSGLLRADDAYFQILLDWWLQEADRCGYDDRERDNALTAASFAETWRDAGDAGGLANINAYELEMRCRRMGMVVADSFTRSFGWSRALIGPEAMRAFNDLVAWWAVATLMPRPFRLGLLDRCFASDALCGVLFAANATATNLSRAAAQRYGTPNRFPFDGVAYVAPNGARAADDAMVGDIVDAVRGTPVFVPIPDHPSALWEMIIPVRLEAVTSMTCLPMPTLPALCCESASAPSLIVRIGETEDDCGDTGMGLVEVHYVEPGTPVDAIRAAAATRPEAARLAGLVDNLWRVQH